MPVTKIVCWRCKKTITGARTVINGFWYCGDCTYLHDHPDVEIAPPVKRVGPRKQKETLFPLPPKREKDR